MSLFRRISDILLRQPQGSKATKLEAPCAIDVEEPSLIQHHSPSHSSIGPPQDVAMQGIRSGCVRLASAHAPPSRRRAARRTCAAVVVMASAVGKQLASVVGAGRRWGHAELMSRGAGEPESWRISLCYRRAKLS